MKAKMKKDLIQGLLTYPAPVSGGRRNSRVAVGQRRFFQIIPVSNSRNRLSRRRKVSAKLIGG